MREHMQNWLKSEEFNVFLESAVKTGQILQDLKAPAEEVQKSLVEMGRRYNHFIVQVTEFAIAELKAVYDDQEAVAKESLLFIQELEREAANLYPDIMKFFFTYREKTQAAQQ